MKRVREQIHIFVRRFGLLNASCCEACCGEKVSLVQGHILFEVCRMGTPSMQQVADELGIDITTFSRQVASMEKKGLLTRRRSDRDRRVNLLGLTGEGKQMMDRIDRYMDGKTGQLFLEMSPFEREVITRSLGLLNEALARIDNRSSDGHLVACCK